KGPVGQPATIGIYQAWKLGKILRLLRPADALDEVRRTTDLQGERRQPACDHGGILQARNADCYVKSLFHEIHETIIQVDVEDDVRMLLGKINQRLADRRVRKSPGCGEFDAAAYVPGGI